MINKEQLIRLAIRNAVIIAIAVIIAASIIWYLSMRMTDIIAAINEQQRLSYILERRTETYQSLKKDFAEIGDVNKKIVDTLVPADDISSYLSALDTLGTQVEAGQSYHFGVPQPPTDTSEPVLSDIDYTLSLGVNRYGLITYMKKFERMPYLGGIYSISMTSGSARGLDDISSVSMTAKLYVKNK